MSERTTGLEAHSVPRKVVVPGREERKTSCVRMWTREEAGKRRLPARIWRRVDLPAVGWKCAI